MAKRKLMDKEEFDKKALNYVKLLLSGNKVTEDITYAGSTFTVMYPLPSDLKKIDRLMAESCGDTPPRFFTPKAIYTSELYATLDVVVIDGPSWWKSMKSWQYCPFDGLAAFLYRRWLRFYSSVRVYLTPSVLSATPGDSGEESSDGSIDEAVDGGAFSDIAYRPEDAKSKS